MQMYLAFVFTWQVENKRQQKVVCFHSFCDGRRGRGCRIIVGPHGARIFSAAYAWYCMLGCQVDALTSYKSNAFNKPCRPYKIYCVISVILLTGSLRINILQLSVHKINTLVNSLVIQQEVYYTERIIHCDMPIYSSFTFTTRHWKILLNPLVNR